MLKVENNNVRDAQWATYVDERNSELDPMVNVVHGVGKSSE